MSLMMKMLNNCSDDLEDFNYDFLLNYRKKKFEGIKLSIENIFKEALQLLEPYGFKYRRCVDLTPEEVLDFIVGKFNKYNKNKDKYFEVHVNTLRLVRYEFIFQNTIVETYISIPYLKDHKINYGGVNYYPDLPILEKCTHVNKSSGLVLVKVSRAPLMFWKTMERSFIDIHRNIFHEVIITTKIHMGINKNKAKLLPLILYHLVEGFDNAKARHGFEANEIDFVTSKEVSMEDLFYLYFRINDDIFLKINKESFIKDINKKRFVFSVLVLLEQFNLNFSIGTLKDPNAMIWLLILGKYTYSNEDMKDNDHVVIDSAKDHILTNRTMIDGVTRKAFEKINIEFGDFSDFLYKVFINIDEWFSSYDPADLYDKRIVYTSIFSVIDRKIYTKVYETLKAIKKNNGEMDIKMANKFKYNGVSGDTWYVASSIFQSNPTLYNSNAGLGILNHRFFSIDSDESGGTKKTKHTPMDVQLAHPSRLAVVAVTTIPSSSPIVSGSISAFLNVDDDGNLIVSEDTKEYLKNVYQ